MICHHTSQNKRAKVSFFKGWKFLKKLWRCVGGGNKVIWLYQLSCKCKLATVTSYKADVSSVSPSSERMEEWRKHLRDVERNDKDASKPVARHFNLPNHSKQHMAICGLSLHLGSSESRKTLEQKFIFQIGTLIPIGINERFSFY